MLKNTVPKSIFMRTIVKHYNKTFELNEEEKQLWKQLSHAESDRYARAAFDKIFDLYSIDLFQWILRFIKSREISTYIMNESFVILWRKRKALNGADTELRNFLRSVLIRMVIRESKKLTEEWLYKEDKNDADFWKWAEERKVRKGIARKIS